MAIVRVLRHEELTGNSPHTESDATFSIVHGDRGEVFLQVDTYGSSKRKKKGKKSQSIRFSPQAVDQLKKILGKFF